MPKFANVAEIDRIKMCFTVQCYCTIGKTLCTYEVVVDLVPTDVIPDYLEVQESVNDLNCHWYTMEAACAEIFERVLEQVDHRCASLCVRLCCGDARHFPVEVTKERVFG